MRGNLFRIEPQRRPGPPDDARNETPHERLDRNLIELLQEVRVAQTGVQVLFGFLLIVPFSNGFHEVSAFGRLVYYAALVLSGAAAMLLIAPSSHHRILFRLGDKARLVEVANRYAIAGLAAVALSMLGVVLLVSLVVFGSVVGAVATTIAAAACVWCWYVQPLRRRHALGRLTTRR